MFMNDWSHSWALHGIKFIWRSVTAEKKVKRPLLILQVSHDLHLKPPHLVCHLEPARLKEVTSWTLWTAVEMIHNTLKTSEPSEQSPRRTCSAAQRRLWRYSGCRRSSQVESHRRSVCVLSADLNAGEDRARGGSGVIHTIHGLCHLCIGCRLPQVCLCKNRKK